jgi:agmatine deiminase
MNNVLLPEWYPQSAVLMTWPHQHTDWKPQLPAVEPVFVEIVSQIAKRQAVILVCYNEVLKEHIQSLLPPHLLTRIHFYLLASDDTWARDYGPLTVYDGQKFRLLDFTFNGWGNKFSAARDNAITQQLHQQGAFGATEIETLDFILEGGSVETDGQGTLLTTERCLLAKTRNAHLTRDAIEKKLLDTLGMRRFLWLKHGFLRGDDTDSHIDTLARFTDSQTICYVSCDDSKDEHYKELNLMQQELAEFKDDQGNPYRLVPLPWPAAKYDAKNQRLPASYANFLIINEAVLVPTYRDEMDKTALNQLQQCFPNYEIIGIDCLPVIAQGGSLHCLTMQLYNYINVGRIRCRDPIQHRNPPKTVIHQI